MAGDGARGKGCGVKHTAGTWEFKRENDGLESFRVSGGGLILADVLFKRTYQHAPQEDEARANANLISAAPDLLQACRSALKVVSEIADINCENRAGWAHKALDAAIAKAEGRPCA